mgnify:CR=1 FL=1
MRSLHTSTILKTSTTSDTSNTQTIQREFKERYENFRMPSSNEQGSIYRQSSDLKPGLQHQFCLGKWFCFLLIEKSFGFIISVRFSEK